MWWWWWGLDHALFRSHLHVKVPAHSVDPDAVEPAVCQVVEGGAEHIGAGLVRLQVIPDLQAPWDATEREGEKKKQKRFGFKSHRLELASGASDPCYSTSSSSFSSSWRGRGGLEIQTLEFNI